MKIRSFEVQDKKKENEKMLFFNKQKKNIVFR